MYFTFIGELAFNGMETQNPFVREGKTKKGSAPYKTLNMSVVAAKNNRAYTELFGMQRETVKTRSTEGENIEIAWNDRLDTDVIKDVDNMRKWTVTIGDERHEFITEWDMINFIAENVDDLNGKRAIVHGSTSRNEYKGKVSNRFVINSIRVLDDDAKAKNGLQLKAVLYFSKENIDTSSWNEDKQIAITAYTKEYMGKDENGEAIYKYYEQPVVLDASQVDFENEKHVNMLKLRLKHLGCQLADGNKVKVILKKGYASNSFILSYVNGAEEVEFTYDMLTDAQKEAVDFGMNEVEDFRPKGSTFGNRVVLYKVFRPDLTGDYENGLVIEDSETSKEIEANIYVPVPETESVESAVSEAATSESVEEDEEDIFS